MCRRELRPAATGPYCVTFCCAEAARYAALIRVMFSVCSLSQTVVGLSVLVAPVLYVFLPPAVGGSPAVHALLLLCPLMDRLYHRAGAVRYRARLARRTDILTYPGLAYSECAA